MTDDTQTPRCEHTDDMFEAVESTRAAHMQAGILLALKALEFEPGDWPDGSAERHYREQIKLVKSHLTKAIDGNVPDFIGFANEMFGICWDGGSADGGTIQETGEQFGLLKETLMQEPCGDACTCRDCEVDFPVNCYRKTY